MQAQRQQCVTGTEREVRDDEDPTHDVRLTQRTAPPGHPQAVSEL